MILAHFNGMIRPVVGTGLIVVAAICFLAGILAGAEARLLN
jgi:hypothetical protein